MNDCGENAAMRTQLRVSCIRTSRSSLACPPLALLSVLEPGDAEPVRFPGNSAGARRLASTRPVRASSVAVLQIGCRNQRRLREKPVASQRAVDTSSVADRARTQQEQPIQQGGRIILRVMVRKLVKALFKQTRWPNRRLSINVTVVTAVGPSSKCLGNSSSLQA